MIEYQTEAPDKEKYSALFETTGWNQLYCASSEELAQALSNSWYYLSVYDGALLVGFGRVVSDHVIHAMIYDLIVHPEYQSKGIGGEILERLVQHCQEAGLRDVQLFCASGKQPFYEKRGFSARSEDAPGMQIILARKTA
jgi:GNAT superfamily N-acetyltransferase